MTVESWRQEVINGRIFSKMVHREEFKIVCLKMLCVLVSCPEKRTLWGGGS